MFPGSGLCQLRFQAERDCLCHDHNLLKNAPLDGKAHKTLRYNDLSYINNHISADSLSARQPARPHSEALQQDGGRKENIEFSPSSHRKKK